MSTITFDKLAYCEALKSGGFTEQQAKTQANALDDALREHIITQSILKDELYPIKTDIAILKFMCGLILAGVCGLVLKTFF